MELINEWTQNTGPLIMTAMANHPTRAFNMYLDLGNVCASVGFAIERNRSERVEPLLTRTTTQLQLLANEVRFPLHASPS